MENIAQIHLNLSSGQQCVRDFFVCLHENLENWPDVYEAFSFTIINRTTCLACGNRSQSEQTQIYLEMDVPSDGSNLKDLVEKNINDCSIVQYHCEDGCKAHCEADTQSIIRDVNEAQFIIVILRRAIMTEIGIEIVTNKINAAQDIFVRFVFC